MTTPVGFLYTPQQLAGSVRYNSGVLLGNWREDDALNEMRMANHIDYKESGSLTLMKKQSKIAPQVQPEALTSAPSDGFLRLGDTVLLQSAFTQGTLAVSLGQRLTAADAIDADDMYATFACPATGAYARNAIKFVSYEHGEAEATEPVRYGQKVVLEFSSNLGVRGYLGSMGSGRSQLSTQLINKQEVFVQAIRGDKRPPYGCAWEIQPVDVDGRIPSQDTPVLAGAPFVLTHCFTNKRLASVSVSLPTDFGHEYGVCAHTYVETGKVNKMMRETIGRPTHNLISRTETSENHWCVLYA